MLAEITTSKALRALTVLATLGIAYIVVTNGVHRRNADMRHAAGMSALETGDAQSAITLLREAVAMDPEVAEYHASLAHAYNLHRKEAAALLGIDQPALYTAIMQELGTANILCPDDVKLAAAYAYLCLDAEAFGSAGDWDRAASAWRGYLHAHRKDDDSLHRFPVVHTITAMGILTKLADIEVCRARPEAARQLLEEARALTRGMSANVASYFASQLERLDALVQALDAAERANTVVLASDAPKV